MGTCNSRENMEEKCLPLLFSYKSYEMQSLKQMSLILKAFSYLKSQTNELVKFSLKLMYLEILSSIA